MIVDRRQLGRIILVSSGKGGVGKSMVASNLAVGISKAGTAVGLLDADLHGPSQAEMFNLHSAPRILGGKIEPGYRSGVRILSSGMLGTRAKAFVWKGPLLRGVLRQFLDDTDWGNLDYFIIDLPPGTGETLMALLAYVVPVGVLVVTTPQEVACADTRRTMSMLSQLRLPILAVIENMSDFQCPHCGVSTRIFPGEGGASLAHEFSVPKCIAIPISSALARSSDAGNPFLSQEDEDERIRGPLGDLVRIVTCV